MKKNDEKNTANLIMDMAFRLFVEKGYEATNLREIGNEVGINASTIYFYYKSKRELFLDVFNHALEIHINELEKRADTISRCKEVDELKELFISEIEMVYLDSASYLFLLRYRIFPVSDLANETREICKAYDEKEFQIWKPFLISYGDGTEENERELFNVIMKMTNGIINEMLISGQALKKETLEKLWAHCYNYLFDKYKYYL